MPHILTLSTLFPNAHEPQFGIFVERQTRQLAERPGHKVTVVNPVGLPPFPLSLHPRYRIKRSLPRFEIRKRLEIHRPTFPVVPGLSGRWNPKVIATAIAPLIRRIHREQPIDLIDAEFFYPDGPAAMEIAASLGIPFTVKARGADIHHWGADATCRAQMLAAARRAGGLLCVCQALKKDMVALGMPGEKIRVHYTGIDNRHFKPLDRKKLKKEFDVFGRLLVTLGALIPRKGQEYVLDALVHLPDATLFLVGEGPDEARLRTQVERLKLGNRVRFLGNVGHDELPRYLSAADALVLPSSSEGLANAWVESLACGTPIVVCDIGGAREILKKPSAGRIAERNGESIAEMVGQLLDHPPKPVAVRGAVKDFSWKKNSDELGQFFKQVLAEAGN